LRNVIMASLVVSLVCLWSFPAPASALHSARFTVGQSKYVVDGLSRPMDGAPFLKLNRVFVPVRYLA